MIVAILAMLHLSVNIIICASCISGFLGVSASPLQFNAKDERSYLLLTPEKPITALEKIVHYFMKTVQNATVDFAFGIRVIEGKKTIKQDMKVPFQYTTIL